MTDFITHRELVAHLLNNKGLVGEAAEIGTERGNYALLLLTIWNGRMLHCIDPFVTQPWSVYADPTNRSDFTSFHAIWQERTRCFRDRVTLHRMYSHEAAPRFRNGQLDFVHVDGNHSYDAVKLDLALWWPKLRSGGLMSGHDYYDCDAVEYQCGVKRAVDEFAAAQKLPLLLTDPGWNPDCQSWWIWKP